MSAYTHSHIKAGSAVEKELDRLHNLHGKLTNDIVLDAATDPANPLHKQFEWDDALAAHRYRLEQAGRIVAAVVLVWKQKKTRHENAAIILTPAYPSVGGGKKVKRQQALSDAEMRKHIIRSKLNSLKATVQSVADMQELNSLRCRVIADVDATAAKLGIDLD